MVAAKVQRPGGGSFTEGEPRNLQRLRAIYCCNFANVPPTSTPTQLLAPHECFHSKTNISLVISSESQNTIHDAHTHPARPRSLPAAKRFPPTPAATGRPAETRATRTRSNRERRPREPTSTPRRGALEMKERETAPPSSRTSSLRAARSGKMARSPPSANLCWAFHGPSIQTDFRGDLPAALATSI